MSTSPELVKVQNEIRELENRLGISDEVGRALGAHTPLDWGDGDNSTYGEYIADQMESQKEALRSVYFGISDTSARKRLISLRRIENTLISLGRNGQLASSQDDAKRIEGKLANTTWLVSPFVLTTVLVGLGAHFLGVWGAVVGALMGLASAFDSISQTRIRLQNQLTDVQEMIQSQCETIEFHKRLIPDFSERESISGQPDQ
jgi:hypothetical protein